MQQQKPSQDAHERKETTSRRQRGRGEQQRWRQPSREDLILIDVPNARREQQARAARLAERREDQEG